MKCEDVNKEWNHYIQGKSSKEKEREIDLHIEQCEQCNERLEAHALSEQVIPTNEAAAKQSKRFIRTAKLKNRLSTFITFIMLCICFILFSSLVTGFFYSWNDRMDRARLVNQTFFQMTSNNMILEAGVMQTTPFMKVNYDFSIKKKVGKEFVQLGKHEPDLFFNRFTNYRFEDGVSLTDLYFVNRNKKVDHLEENVAWKTLEKLPEGTVSEIAVTLTEGLSYDELFQLLSSYDINLAWAGIETERISNYEYELMYPGLNVIGMNEDSLFDLSSIHQINGIQDDDGEIREEIVKTSLQFLIDNNNYTKQLNRNSAIKQFDPADALKYIEENGLQLYGAILTGPTKELLRLQNEKQILFATMGETEFWNWDTW